MKPKKSAAPADDDIGRDIRLQLFRMQLELRLCEKRAYDLFLQNLIKGTSHLSLGQEAIAAAFGVAMRPDDWTFCTYRGHAHTLARAASMRRVLGELMGRECGLLGGKGGSMHLTDVAKGAMGSYAIIASRYARITQPPGALLPMRISPDHLFLCGRHHAALEANLIFWPL